MARLSTRLERLERAVEAMGGGGACLLCWGHPFAAVHVEPARGTGWPRGGAAGDASFAAAAPEPSTGDVTKPAEGARE